MKILFAGQSTRAKGAGFAESSLQRRAEIMGHELVYGIEDQPDVVVVQDWNRASGRVLRQARFLGILRVLVKAEPKAVIPEHGHLKKIADSFDLVIEPGRPNLNPLVNYPQKLWDFTYFSSGSRMPRVIAISANKYSFVPGENYSLRALAYSKLSVLDVFGEGWDRSIVKSAKLLAKELVRAFVGNRGVITLRPLLHIFVRPVNILGPVQDKLPALAKYKASLVIENSSDYMSEKLLDSILAGAIPVYVGPPLESFGIPPELAITAEPNSESICRAVEYAIELPYEEWATHAKIWLDQIKEGHNWKASEVNSSILTMISERLSQ